MHCQVPRLALAMSSEFHPTRVSGAEEPELELWVPVFGVGSLGMAAAQPFELLCECKPHFAGVLSIPAVKTPSWTTGLLLSAVSKDKEGCSS